MAFIIERVREDFINGRYVEKISYQEVLTTPFGDQQIFDRTEYRQLEFNLFAKVSQHRVLGRAAEHSELCQQVDGTEQFRAHDHTTVS